MKEQIISQRQVSDYAAFLREQEKSEATVRKYLRDLRRFAAFAAGRPVTKLLVIGYKKALTPEYAVSSANSMLSSLNSFFGFAGWDSLRVALYKRQRNPYRAPERQLSKPEYFLLLSAARESSERLYLALQTICACGIRVSELPYITVQAVNEGRTSVRCKNKIRTIFIPDELAELLKEYIGWLGLESGSVFITSMGKPLHRNTIWRDMKKAGAQAGIPESKLFPHNLRHFFALTYYEQYGDLAKLADVLGHISMDTTRIYIATDGERQARQVSSLSLVQPAHCLHNTDYASGRWLK